MQLVRSDIIRYFIFGFDSDTQFGVVKYPGWSQSNLFKRNNASILGAVLRATAFLIQIIESATGITD